MGARQRCYSIQPAQLCSEQDAKDHQLLLRQDPLGEEKVIKIIKSCSFDIENPLHDNFCHNLRHNFF